MLYTFAGIGANDVLLDSIERLDASKAIRGEPVEWQLMNLNMLPPRSNTLVAPIGRDEILLFGGKNNDGQELGDGYILNVNDCSVEQVFSTVFGFKSENNQCLMTKSGQVTAIVQEGGTLRLVTYTRG